MTQAAALGIHNKDHPFPALVIENRLLTPPGCAKETRHFVVSTAGSGLRFKPGDSLGVCPSNRPADVDAVLAALAAGGGERVVPPRGQAAVSLREALESRVALAGPTRRLLETLASRASAPSERAALAALLSPGAREALAAWLAEREFADVLEEFPSARPCPQELMDHMRRLTPRLYSIASSPRVHPDEAHLTVAVVRYRTNGRDRVGVCSTYLADRVAVGRTPMPVFVAHSHFGPPQDGSRDAIMVGPGTGIAPFRAFIEDRAATGATGRNWLFFGDQKRACDFAYEEEWSRHLRDGALQRLDTAFSRDQDHKIYVQDRMRENAAELWNWIRGGAHFYVCGDAKRMAKDVDAALHEVIAGQGGMPMTQAIDYVNIMKRERRYQRDVY
jgi:sulfite reductase (NADPH) flavoprotein alpha-component